MQLERCVTWAPLKTTYSQCPTAFLHHTCRQWHMMVTARGHTHLQHQAALVALLTPRFFEQETSAAKSAYLARERMEIHQQLSGTFLHGLVW